MYWGEERERMTRATQRREFIVWTSSTKPKAHTLAQKDVAHSLVDVLVHGVTAMDHQTINELHALGTLSTELAGDDHFATLSTALHDVAQHSIAGAADSQTAQQLVAQRLALGDGAQATVLDLLGEQHNGVVLEVEPLLHGSRQLANTLALLAENIVRQGGTDDDLGLGRRNANLHTAVAILRQLLGEHFVQLGVEHAIGDELRNKARN